MRIPCPYCGSRDVKEFVSRGEAQSASGFEVESSVAFDALYIRSNPIGRTREYFYHATGCRSWLLVERDVRTHEIYSAAFANTLAGS
jgi:heterotetrameric sarcosine oxidase delta subunit